MTERSVSGSRARWLTPCIATMGQVASPSDIEDSSPRLHTSAPEVHCDSACHCIGTTEQTLVHGSFDLLFLSKNQNASNPNDAFSRPNRKAKNGTTKALRANTIAIRKQYRHNQLLLNYRSCLDVKEPAHTRFVVSLIYNRTTTPEWRVLVRPVGYVPW
jgi:hypothetical protein